MLARYTYHHDRTARRLRAVEAPQLYHTVYASPQLELWELDDAQWRKVLERPPRRRRQLRALDARLQQLELPIVGLVMAFLTVRLG